MKTLLGIGALALATVVPLVGAEADGIELQVVTDARYYSEHVDNTVFVQVTVRSLESTAESNPGGRNLGLVVDRSGSMTGERIQAARQSVINALNQMSPDDIVSLVVFGSEVETVLEAQKRSSFQNVEQMVNRIEPAGGTALYDALNQAAAQVRRHATASSMNHLLVICDGRPNKGPRERADFVRLAGLFANEGITISTIGLGSDFDEDMLADIARVGGGRFHFASSLAELDATILNDLAPFHSLVGRDLKLSLRFKDLAEEIEALGWEPAELEEQTLTWHLPHLMAGQVVTLYAQAEIDGWRSRISLDDFALAELAWTNPAGEAGHLEAATDRLYFSSSREAIQSTRNEGVFGNAVGLVISEAMQEAIDLLDEGDPRAARRVLQRARGRAVALNYQIDDPEVGAQIEELDAYLAEVKARGLNQLDRKILRSGLFNRFVPPVEEDEDTDENADRR